MARSVYQQFVGELRRRWRSELPSPKPVEVTFAPAMPKSSTFYAGTTNRLGRHVFLSLQNHSKSWHVGEFTVNVVLSSSFGAPSKWLTLDRELGKNSEGSHRLGMLLYGKDRWWCLRDTDTGTASPGGQVRTQTWRWSFTKRCRTSPTTYSSSWAGSPGLPNKGMKLTKLRKLRSFAA